MLLSDLPVGAKVKDPETTYYGVPIVFLVAAKNHEGYPDNSVTLITEKIITLKSFDAIEPSNSNTNRRSYGNNRYLHSNIRQWLNKDTQPWYVAQHGADQPPTTANVWSGHNPYDSEKGFLANFSANFKNRILTTTLTVVKNTVTDGGGSETVQDKVFLPSTTEVGLANENGIAEGSRWPLFTADNSSRLANPTPEAVSNSSYTSTSLSASQSWWWWLRTPYSGSSYIARNVHTSGALNGSDAWYGNRGARPALNLPSDIRVSDNPDADGAYILRWVEISVPQGDIGIKTDKSNLLTYSITGDEMSEITEKVNGEVISRKTLSSGEETQINLTEEQWDKIKYGKYAPNWNNIIPKFDATSFQYFNNSYAEDRVSLVVFDEGEAGGYVPVTPNKKYCFRFTHYSDDINLDFYVSSGNYLDGVYEEVKSHVNERINLNTGKSLEDNFKEYTFVPESNYVFIKFSAWGWGNYDEASITYMSLVNSFIDNTLTIEMDSNKWEYTFDKRLADGANIHEIIKATKDANEIVLPTKKAKIVEAIRETGGNANDEDSLEELADRIRILDGSIMRYASGTVTSNSNTLSFQYAGHPSTNNFRYVELTDIPFVPKRLVINFENVSNRLMTFYDETDSYYPKTFKLGVWTESNISSTNFNIKADTNNAVISKGLVRVPTNVNGNGITGKWEAWG